MCTSHIHLYICPSLHVGTAVREQGRETKSQETPQKAGEDQEESSLCSINLPDTNITSLLSALAAIPHSSPLNTPFELGKRPSGKAGAWGKKQWVDFSSCWTIVACGGSGDGGSGHGGGHHTGLPEPGCCGITGAPVGRAGLAQTPKLKPRRVTRSGETTGEASGGTGLPCHGWGAAVGVVLMSAEVKRERRLRREEDQPHRGVCRRKGLWLSQVTAGFFCTFSQLLGTAKRNPSPDPASWCTNQALFHPSVDTHNRKVSARSS